MNNENALWNMWLDEFWLFQGDNDIIYAETSSFYSCLIYYYMVVAEKFIFRTSQQEEQTY